MSDSRNLFKVTPAPRPEIEREEKVGDCFKKVGEFWNHYYLVREKDVLHVTENCINTLFDNTITDGRHNRGEKYIPIKRAEFNEKLNEQIFSLNIFAKEFKSV
jgi:hypothetical protein